MYISVSSKQTMEAGENRRRGQIRVNEFQKCHKRKKKFCCVILCADRVANTNPHQKKTTSRTPSTGCVMHQSMWKCKHITVMSLWRYLWIMLYISDMKKIWLLNTDARIRVLCISLSTCIYLHFLWIALNNFELCGVGLNTAIKT